MPKKTLAVILAHWCLLFHAQTKLNTALIKEIDGNPEGRVTCLVKGDIALLQNHLEKFEGHFHYSAGNIASVTLPLSAVKALSAQAWVQRMELVQQKLRVLDDSALRKSNVLKIHAGAAPLSQSYNGSGVLLGIIDTGTDIHHPDFKDSTGKTRIAYLWDQNFSTAANTPQPYNYGREWSAVQIDSGLCTHDDYVEMSHGTKVAGVAAGNGASAPMYKGIAPGCDLITVAVDFNNPGPTITDAMNYIITKATLLGKPVVINLSLGDYFGSHDGKDLQAQMIDNMVNNLPGRAVIAAAGNAGSVPFHMGYVTSATDTNFTWISNNTATLNFQVYADSLDFKNVNFRIGAYHNTSFSYKGHTPFQQIDSVLGVIHTDTLVNNGNRIGIIKTVSDYSDGVYALDVSISADSLNYLWSFATNGTGKIDSWSFDYVSAGLPNTGVLPAMTFYKRPDTLQTICTSFQCGKHVITVANYTDRTAYVDVSGNTASFPGTDGDIFPTSSFGPTRDGRIKPEIAASGENIATTGALPILSWLIQNFPFAVTQDSLHMTFGGTSAAAPVVTGLAALYFQKYPAATVSQLRQDIINCSYQDLFTTSNIPNNRWGYGKLDGFGALTCSGLTTGLQSTGSEKKLLVYPNPAKDWLSIDAAGPCEIVVTNIAGRELRHVALKNSQIDISTLAPGLYFITVITATERVSQPFIKVE